ncbi:MAG: hypothetical protein ACFHX7_18140 [Pseudomonadota bacterium]
MSEAFRIHESGGVVSGPVREPRNSAINAGAGSIHDDATAQKLGFRGGTVAGSLHMEQFPPLLAEVLGDEWLQTGSQSLYFKYATTDGEPVQAFAERPTSASGSRQVRIWMDNPAGERICEGTASVGEPDMASAVRQRIASTPEPEDLRILAKVEIGKPGPLVPTRISQDVLDGRLAVITEPLAAYSDASIYGEKVITPALQVRIMRPGEAALLPRDGNYGVGLFGAIELQALAGPVFVEHDYLTSATVLAVGSTPKTEYYYYESTLVDAATDTEVMKMLMMIRFMKASSKLYQ